MNTKGSLNIGFILIIIVVGLIMFFLGPKYLSSNKIKQKQKTNYIKKKKNVPYVDTYKKGTTQAKKLIQAGKERGYQ